MGILRRALIQVEGGGPEVQFAPLLPGGYLRLLKADSVTCDFIAPMLLQPVSKLPEGEQWLYELKFDGFRGIIVKNGPSVQIWSRNRKNLTARFDSLVEAVRKLPAKSLVLDGEIVCLDPEGRPCFEDLQNYAPGKDAFLFFYAFDLLSLNGAPLLKEPLVERKKELAASLAKSEASLRVSGVFQAEADDLVSLVRAQRLEGIVAKQKGSIYQPGKRTGKWVKYKTLQEREFVIGGYLPSPEGVAAVAVGFFQGSSFRYAGKLEVYPKPQKKALERILSKARVYGPQFANVPIKARGDSWSAGIAAEELERFIWVEPRCACEVQFLEWTRAGYLRQAKFVSASAGSPKGTGLRKLEGI